MCTVYHNKYDDLFKYPWVGVLVCGSSKYSTGLIMRTFQNDIIDSSKDPSTMSFKFVLLG